MSLNRVAVALYLALALPAAPSPAASAHEPPPNIILFLADDLGYGDLGCYGHPIIQTPHLDAFAKQGLRLTQCYSASAVCSPSRSALLTGRTPHRNGVFTWIAEDSPLHLRTSEQTLPTLLSKSGYSTCHVGKWHLNGRFNHPDQPQPNHHGYDWWMATQNNAAPSHNNPVNFVRNGQPVGPLTGYSALLTVDEAAAWLKQRNQNTPFFLTVWTHEPHYPISSAPEFQQLYPELQDQVQREHHANVTQLDAAFGRLMKTLDDQGLSNSTLVMFTSDNGPEGNGVTTPGRGSTGGLRGRKRDLYEGGIRVPGIVRWPGKVPAGAESAVPVIGSDFFPTALAAAGVPQPQERQLDGVNILPVLTAQADALERPRPLYWRLLMAPKMKSALRLGDWKILADQQLQTFELYHIGNDPAEATDLAQQEPQKLTELRQLLLQLTAEIDAEGPDWWKTLGPNGGRNPADEKNRTKKKAK